MIVDEVNNIMAYVEIISKNLGDEISNADYYIEDLGCPHMQPKCLPKGYAAIYMFVYGTETDYEYLKIGKANSKSQARFVSQHYGFNAASTLARSLCSDYEFVNNGVNPNNVKDWMKNNLHRINIYIKESCGKKATQLVESIMHYKFLPRYEGNI